MKKLAFAVCLSVLGACAVTPASADYAVVKFNSGYCRVWTGTAAGPQDGHFLWFRKYWGGHYHWYYRFPTLAGAQHGLHKAVWRHRCYTDR